MRSINSAKNCWHGCSRDYAASRGEYFSARLIAEYLHAEFIDPADYLLIRANGTIDPESYRKLGDRLADPGTSLCDGRILWS